MLMTELSTKGGGRANIYGEVWSVAVVKVSLSLSLSLSRFSERWNKDVTIARDLQMLSDLHHVVRVRDIMYKPVSPSYRHVPRRSYVIQSSQVIMIMNTVGIIFNCVCFTK